MNESFRRIHRFTVRDGLSLAYRRLDAARRADALPVLCLAGYSRNSADFEAIATKLARQRTVLCLDSRGRGRSDYDPRPERYNAAVEAEDAAALIAHLSFRRIVLIGTSRGGVLAMLLAGAYPDRVAGVVLNDIGAAFHRAGLERIARHLVTFSRPFADWDEAAEAVKKGNESQFPDFDAQDWLAFARRTCRACNGGKAGSAIVPDHDPALCARFAEDIDAAPPDLWPLFRGLSAIPTLVLRGALSDVLTAQTLERMHRVRSGLLSCVVRRRGHAPLLDEPECVRAITRFLETLRDGPAPGGLGA